MASKQGKKIGCAVGCLLLLGAGIWLYPLVRIAIGMGIADPELKSKYVGDTMTNLKRISESLLLYKESEGQFPDAAGWMDAAFVRLKTSDLTEEEAKKKLKDPSLADPTAYGFAMNDAVSGKTDKEFPDPEKVMMIFSSQSTAWNAHGKFPESQATPPRPGGNAGILASGKVVKIADWLKTVK